MHQEDFNLSHYWQFPPKFHRNTRKTDKVYDFLQSSKLTCVDDIWARTLRSISQSPRATSVRHHSLTSFGIPPNRRFVFKIGKIANNAIDGSLLDTLVPKWWWISNNISRLKKKTKSKSVTYLGECWRERKDW